MATNSNPIGFAVLDLNSTFVTVNDKQIWPTRAAADMVIELHADSIAARLQVVEVSLPAPAPQATYVPRPSTARGAKAKGLQAVDAFDTSWTVVDSPTKINQVDHEDRGWVFGVAHQGRFAQQVCAQVK